MPRPGSADDLRRFLGMITYYSRFFSNVSTITAPLRRLLQKNAAFNWTTQCESAFIKLKQEIASDRVLTPFNPKLQIQLACDASPFGVAGILSHIIDGQEHPIAFASRSLTQAEQNYSQLDREALAIVFSVDHFYQYLFARPFKLVTDNRPLERIFHQQAKLPKMTSARLQRYAAFLSGFNYELVFKKGVENSNVDCLSRAPIALKPKTDGAINEEVHQLCEMSMFHISAQQLTYQTIRDATQKDEKLSKLLRDLQTNNSAESEFIIDNNILFRGQRVVVPAVLQESVLQELHRSHIGITKMKQLARRYVYWQHIDQDIERLVRSCSACVAIKSSPCKAPLHPWQEPEHNWERIHIDYAGPFQEHYFLVIMDAKSKWAEIEICSSAPTTASTIDSLQNVFARHGFPDVMVSDNATIFTSELFQQFCKNAGIFQKFSAPGHPATNGLAERNVQTLKHRLAAMVNERTSMRHKVREILFRYRATPLHNNKTPSELYLNRQLRIQLDALKPCHFQKSEERPTGSSRQYSVGDRVQARYYANGKQNWKVGSIIKKFGLLHYVVKFDDGFELKRHINQLRLTEVAPAKTKKQVVFTDDNPRVDTQVPNLGDLTSIPNIPMDHQTPPEVTSQLSPDPPVRRSSRVRRTPHHLSDYVKF